MSCKCCFLLVLCVTEFISASEFTVAPMGKTVLLGTSTEFHCTTSGFIPVWVIDGSELDQTSGSVHGERGITRCLYRQVSGGLFSSMLCVEANHENNNTRIQCEAFNSGVVSQPAILKIQGILAPPTGLQVTVLNYTTAHLTWSPPFTLNISNSSHPNILGYGILILSSNQEVILAANSTMNEYFYHSESNACDLFDARVAALNGVGRGNYSSPVSHAIVLSVRALRSPNTSTILSNRVHQFHCEVHCHDSLLVTWQINQNFLSELSSLSGMPRVVSQGSSYANRCTSGVDSLYNSTLEVIPESLDSFTVQCVAIHVCGDSPGESEAYTGCSPTVCYGQLFHVEVIQTPDSEGDKTTHHSNTFTTDETAMPIIQRTLEDNAKHTGIELAAYTAAGITTFFSAILIVMLSISITVCRRIRRKQNAVPNLSATNNATEPIYEQCGGPPDMYGVSVNQTKTTCDSLTHLSSASIQTFGGSQVNQNQPRTRSQTGYVMPPTLHTQPCEAYGSTHPVDTQPCEAYGSTLPANTQPCEAYGSTLPANTQPCEAYGSTLPANTQPCEAYGSTHPSNTQPVSTQLCEAYGFAHATHLQTQLHNVYDSTTPALSQSSKDNGGSSSHSPNFGPQPFWTHGSTTPDHPPTQPQPPDASNPVQPSTPLEAYDSTQPLLSEAYCTFHPTQTTRPHDT